MPGKDIVAPESEKISGCRPPRRVPNTAVYMEGKPFNLSSTNEYV